MFMIDRFLFLFVAFVLSSSGIHAQADKDHHFKVAKNLPDDFAMEWDIPYSIITSILINNSYFKAEVTRWIRLYAPDKVIVVTSGGGTGVDVNTITWEQLVAYSRSTISKIAPIRVVKQQSKVQDFTTVTDVSGWKANTVVLRPMGFAGVLVHAETSGVELMRSGEVNSNIQFSLAKIQNFLYVINKITPNGMLKSYHTDVIGRYATVLDESLYHVVVDIATAD